MNVDVPPPDDVTTPWWDATREHRLVVQTCVDCGHHQHPPRAVCIACGNTDGLTFTLSASAGTVDSWTQLHRAPRPDVDVPYVIARVRLDEGPLLLTQLLGAAPWQIGEPVRAEWHDIPDGRSLPMFGRPSTSP